MRKFLIVEDDPTLQFVLQKVLANPDYALIQASDGTEALERLRHEVFDLIISDLRMQPMDGFTLLQSLPPSAVHTPFIVMTVVSDVTAAARLMEAGAFDYVAKPINIRALKDVVHRALGMRDRRLLLMSDHDGGRISEPPLRFGRLVALSSGTVRACDLIEQVAPTRAPLVMCGEPGTGRTALARATHERSGCAGALLEIAVDSASHDSSSDAETVAGWMKQSNCGTLLLKNVEHMPMGIQQALLDWHLAHTAHASESPAHPRIISTTETSLGGLVSEGHFLSPLAHWIGLIHVPVEPLRRRREDLTGLCRLFLARESARCGVSFSLDPQALAAIEAYTWPGNIDELSAVLSEGSSRASSSGDRIGVDHLPQRITETASSTLPSQERELRGHAFKGFLRQKEAEQLKKLIELHGGDLALAAKAASVPLSTLERRWRECQA